MQFWRTVPAIMLLLSIGWADFAIAREFTDMAGRTVNIPDKPQRVYTPAPPGGSMIYTLAPEALCTFFNAPGAGIVGRDLLDPRVRTLPNVGSLSGEGAAANLEKLMELSPDLILMFPKSLREIENIAVQNRVVNTLERLNVPYVYGVAADIREYPAAYECFGAALGVPERGKILADYIRETLAQAEQVVAQVPPAQRPKVYYATAPDGLTTTSQENSHGIILKLCGDVGVFRGNRDPGAASSHVKISLEQVLGYDPDVIVASSPIFYQQVFDNPAWQNVKAVRDQRVYLIPLDPWNWYDRPPSFMSALGLKWTLNLLYPEQYSIDIVDEAVAFYRLFLWSDVTHDEMRKIIYPENR